LVPLQRLVASFLLLAAGALPRPAAAQDISVAAASDLTFAMGDLIPGFARATGHQVRLSTGSSGVFFAQIQNGAPFDLFFSADIDYPRQLETSGLIEPGSLYIYAVGRIVLWVRNDSPLDVSKGWVLVTDPRVRKIAIANPLHAPYGRAAEAAMLRAGVYDRVANKLVLGENISQAAQFVDSGNADIGVLALSLATAATMNAHGRWWPVPADSYPRLEQAAVVLRSSQKKEIAGAFLAYVRSAEGKAILQRHGLSEPPGAAASAQR
jgi:molybdate transport system substrate-binding protein